MQSGSMRIEDLDGMLLIQSDHQLLTTETETGIIVTETDNPVETVGILRKLGYTNPVHLYGKPV